MVHIQKKQFHISAITDSYITSFGNKEDVVNIRIPKTCVEIGNYAFSGCTNLTQIKLNENIETIGEGAFENCNNITYISIPTNVTVLGANTFNGCFKLETIDGVINNIPDYIFTNCSSLKDVEISNGITIIGKSAFLGCCSLTHVVIPSGVTEIDTYAFSGCSNVKDLEIYTQNITVDTFSYPLSFMRNAEKVTIGKNVSLTEYSFDSSGMKELVVSSSYIPRRAFEACMNLSNIVITKDVEVIGPTAFAHGGASNVTIEPGVRILSGVTFESCTELREIVFPDTVEYIGEYTFNGCTSLTKVTLSNNLRYIGECCFYTSPINYISIPSSVEYIGDSNFYNVKEIYYNASAVPTSKNIGSAVNITKITFGDNVTTIGEHALSRKLYYGAPEIVFGQNIKTIDDYAFEAYDTTYLSSIELPNSVEYIGNYAFNRCRNLTSITLGNNVTNVGTEAFNNCSSLSSIYINSITEPCSISDGTFYNISRIGTLHVAKGGTKDQWPTWFGENYNLGYSGYTWTFIDDIE